LDELPESLPDLRQRIRRNRSDAEALHKLGLALTARGEYRRSFICHRAAAGCCPEDSTYQFHCASAAFALSRTADAKCFLDKALSIHPGDPRAWKLRGDLYLDQLARPAEALHSYVRAIELAPQDASIYQSAARCVLNGGGPGEAIASLRDALPRDEDPLNADRGVALALAEEGGYEHAVPILHDFLRQRPGDQTSMRVLAEMYTGLRDLSAAQSWLERAFAAGPDPQVTIALLAHWCRLGDFERSRQVFRSRMRDPLHERIFGNCARRWEGQDIPGKTMRVVVGDIYFGDALQFVRFVRVAKHAGARVIVQCPKRIRSLLRTVEGVDAVIAPYDAVPSLDYDVVAFWLMFALALPLEEMIGAAPYLQAPADLRAEWRKRIARTAGINVGIVWHGSPHVNRDPFRRRSMALEYLRPLAAIPGVTLYSLQTGQGRTELLNAKPPFPAIDLAPDFPNTAAAIEALDVVVTIDTSIAHLAGALGKRTFLMLPYNPCFRWMMDRDDTPWYSAMRLFRQTKPGEWSDVVSAVSRALQK
jgi:tetratricopeptide (TPR) repeat protein